MHKEDPALKQVVLIMVDTQRKDMVGCYDKAAPPTPHLNALAENSLRFENAFTCQPVCGPARSALFTGLYPHTNGMEANSMPLRSGIPHIGQMLSQSGIACGYIGKWHLDGGDYFGYGKCPDGFDKRYWYDMRNFLDELPDDRARRKSRQNMNGRRDDPKEEDTFAHRCCDRAIRFLEEHRDRDFFLTVSLDEPHDPSVCPRRFFRALRRYRFRLKRNPNVRASLKYKPVHQQIWREKYGNMPFFWFRHIERAMFACNSFCDYELGRVLDKIDALGIQPMIIYTADHGDMFFSHGLLGKGCVMYNEITNIPLLISGGDFPKGVSQTPVSHIDMVPTVLQYFGVQKPKALTGEALQTVDLQTPRRDVHIEYTRYEVDHDSFMGFQPIRCIFDGRYKLVINLMTTDELYDLETDPFEMTNLIHSTQHAAIRNALHDRLLDHMNHTRDLYRGYYWACRPWRKDKTASFDDTGFIRQKAEDDFVQLDYSTGLPMQSAERRREG